MATIDDSTLYEIITGRVEPHIYSFETNTLPNLLKVGDTYRPVEERLHEWRRYYKDLSEISRHKAVINDEIFFRDHSVHKYLEGNGILREPLDVAKGIYSKEFFNDITKVDVDNAVRDVIESYGTPGKYAYYDQLKDRVEQRYAREQDFAPRDNQQQVIDNFTKAVENGRTNLLMYAVMRFGKSIASMWCAKKIDSKLTVVVSAKSDVRSEWKQTVESHKDFAGYRFIDGADLEPNTNLSDIYDHIFLTGGGEEEACTNIVIFFTLQDLAGSTDEIKARHVFLKQAAPDLLIIDETHFGARAQVLGKILAGIDLTEEDQAALKDTEGVDDLGKIGKLEAINAKIKLHLSGTPYRILMGSEFEQDDIIAFIQFSDIYESKIKWRQEHIDQEEWQNPYYGFPQMIRFAFNPNESSRKKLESIPGSKPAEIFAPVSTSKTGDYETFKNESEATELLQVLDGTKHDTQLLGLLDHESIKAGKLAQHVVIVLPYRASCDAFEKLISKNRELFKNISEYTLLNISGHNSTLTKPEDIKNAIAAADEAGKKTITLTVNKMLTGTTVPQWDTMIYLKATVSPQEYDQAIFRLQSPWIKTYTNEAGEVIKYDMKPQTLLVDLDPTRLFYLQELKAFTYGANTHTIGNENIEKFIERELKVSPILALNAENNKLMEVEASKIIDAVRKYSSERSITDDVNEISVDLSLRDHEDIYSVIKRLSELSSKNGLRIPPTDDDGGQELDGDPNPDTPSEEGGEDESGSPSGTSGQQDDDTKSFEKQFRMYYVLILLFAFLSDTNEKSLTDVINNLDTNDDNRRIANSLGLKKEHLVTLRENLNWSVLSSLDYKIQNSDFRANDETITPVEHIEIAINKFGKLSDSEVFTPSITVDRIFDAFDDNFWHEVKSAKILDIASKSGNFAHGFVTKAQQYGASLEDIKDSVYSIPTSPPAYEFTRKMYKALGLNTDNIAQQFTSYDILDVKSPLAITSLLLHKKLGEITKEDLIIESDKIEYKGSKEDRVKFTAIVGNPPYDIRTGTNFAKSIYNEFLDEAVSLDPDFVCMIHPAKFLFNSGATPKAWNKKMLHDPHLSIEMYEPDIRKVFPSVGAKGGVCITLWNKNNPPGGLGGVFVADPTLRSILEKTNSNVNLDTIISSAGGSPTINYTDKYGRRRSYFRTSAFFDLADMFSHAQSNEYNVKVYGLQRGNIRTERYTSSKNLRDNTLNSWKVFLPKSNGSGAMGEVLSMPFIAGPGTGCTESFIRIGSFTTENEAQNALKFIKTKFCRVLLGTLKVTQDNPRSTWRNVPVQDFTDSSDIDWKKSISEIDEQLFTKYELDENEKEFIKNNVRTME